MAFLVVRMQMGTAGSFLERGWGLWTALRGVDPAGGTAAWFGGCCCPSPVGRTFSSASGSTAGCQQSRRGGVRWRSCRSRGCSSCWGWPAGRRAWRWCSQSLRKNRRRCQHLIWGVYFFSGGSRPAALTHWPACWMFILASSLSLSLSFLSCTAFTGLQLTIISLQINLTQLTVCLTPVIVAASVKRCTWDCCQRETQHLKSWWWFVCKFVCKIAFLLSIILMGSMMLNNFYCSLCQTGQILISLHTERNVYVPWIYFWAILFGFTLLLLFTFICFHAKKRTRTQKCFPKASESSTWTLVSE